MKALLFPLKTLCLLVVALTLSGAPLGALAQQAAPGANPSSEAVQAAVVNINTASASEIAAALSGVGPAKAEAIVAWREANGAFTSVEQLLEVKGIGRATLDRNAGKIQL